MFALSISRQIDEFTGCFIALKEALASGITVQTSIVSFRIDETVKHIGEHFNFLFAAVH